MRYLEQSGTCFVEHQLDMREVHTQIVLLIDLQAIEPPLSTTQPPPMVSTGERSRWLMATVYIPCDSIPPSKGPKRSLKGIPYL